MIDFLTYKEGDVWVTTDARKIVPTSTEWTVKTYYGGTKQAVLDGQYARDVLASPDLIQSGELALIKRDGKPVTGGHKVAANLAILRNFTSWLSRHDEQRKSTDAGINPTQLFLAIAEIAETVDAIRGKNHA
jgi:hypothetical protein